MAFPTFTPVTTFNQGQVSNAQNDYGQQEQSALQANQALKSYQQSMQNPSDMYNQNVSSVEKSVGFDPQQLAAANKQLAVTQNQMAMLPQAIQAQGGGYGVTAGQMANNYNQSANNLQGLLATQGNNVNAQQSNYNNALQQAGQQTNFGVQGQQMNLSALQNIASNAYNQQQTALQNMQYLETQYQQQGQWNADQAKQYALANAQYQQALAAANQANAQAELFKQQAQQLPNEQAMIQNYLNHQGGVTNLNSAQQKAASAASAPTPNFGSTNPFVNAVGGLANTFLPNSSNHYLGGLGTLFNDIGSLL